MTPHGYTTNDVQSWGAFADAFERAGEALSRPGLPPELFEPIIFVKRDSIYIANDARIDSFCKLEGGQTLSIGRYVHVASFCHLNGGGGSVVIEDFVGVASGVKVLGASQDLRCISASAAAPRGIADAKREGRATTIRRFAFLATNSVVLPGVIIGEGAVLAAGAVATKNVPAWEIWGGVPARPMHDADGKIMTRVVLR